MAGLHSGMVVALSLPRRRTLSDRWTTVARVIVPITRATSEMYADTDRNLPLDGYPLRPLRRQAA